MSGPMGLSSPTPGGSTNIWGTALNTELGLIENHDHTSGKGVQVPTSGLGLDADLTFNSFAAIALRAVAFTEVAPSAVTSYSDALFVSSTDHNLWFRNQSGVNVQVTAGNTLNISLVGGIGGDYAAVNALLSYDDATHRYLFQQEGSPRPWAGIAAGNVDIYEQAASIANRVRLKSPSALAASYDLTWFAALPASAMGVSVDSAGQWAAGISFAMQANANITLSGTGTYKHGTKTINRPIKSAECYATGGTISNAPPGGLLDASSTIYIPLPDLPKHARLLAVRLYYGSTADAAACTAKLYKTSDAVPVVAGLTDLSVTLTPGGTSIASTTGLTFQYANAGSYWIQVTNTTGGERVSGVGVDYDVP